MSLPPMPANVQSLSLAWLLEEDWPQWLAMDPGFQPDYRAWLTKCDAAFDKYRAAGVPILKVEIRPAEFQAWADAHGQRYGSMDRAHYASYLTILKRAAN